MWTKAVVSGGFVEGVRGPLAGTWKVVDAVQGVGREGPGHRSFGAMRGWHFSLASVGSHGGDFGRGTILLPCHLFDVWSWACQFTLLGLSFPICKIEIIAPTSGLCAKAAARAWHTLAVTVATHLAVS